MRIILMMGDDSERLLSEAKAWIQQQSPSSTTWVPPTEGVRHYPRFNVVTWPEIDSSGATTLKRGMPIPRPTRSLQLFMDLSITQDNLWLILTGSLVVLRRFQRRVRDKFLYPQSLEIWWYEQGKSRQTLTVNSEGALSDCPEAMFHNLVGDL